MKYLALVILLISVSTKASNSWENYLNLPTPQNASLVNSVTNSSKIESELDILEIQIIAGDLQAINLALRISEWFKQSAAVSERLSVIIGRSIRSFPKKYLTALNLSANSNQCLDINSNGLEYVDRIQAQMYETEQRLKAILSVNDTELTLIKNTCADKLKEHHSFLKSIIGN